MEVFIAIIILCLLIFPLWIINENNKKVIIYIVLPKRKYFTIKVKRKDCDQIKFFFNPYRNNVYPEVLTYDQINHNVFSKHFKKIKEIPKKYKDIIESNKFEVY